MDVQQKLDEIVAVVDSARAMPMSASCVVNRAELLAKLDEVREALPGSLAQAEELLGGREQMVAEAQAEAQRIIESGHAERGSLVSGTEVVRRAQEEADRILAEARQEATEIRAEADDYVDSKLANFEVVLSKTIGSVERGREKLLGSGPGSEEWNEEYAEDAPERSADPHELRERADSYVDARLGSVAAVLTKTLEAVGRGRQKLLGHRPIDELAAHMAAQDARYAEGGQAAPHTSDADYLADLAAIGRDGADGAAPAGAPAADQGLDPAAAHGHAVPVAAADQGGYQQHGAVADPYAAQGPPQAPQEGYYGQQDPAHYAYQQDYGYYGQQDTGQYAAYPAQPSYDPYQQQAPQQDPAQAHNQGQAPQQGQAQLDETSFFDTSMIDLSQVREYEARYQGYGRNG